MNKKNRHSLILDIIKFNEIDTQEELIACLKSNNCNVTQATVSRDIQELNLIKVAGEKKKFKYSQMMLENKHINNKYSNIFRECVLSIQNAQNIVVIKTVTGSANSAAAYVDTLCHQNIIGTIAGDDTIFMVACDTENAVQIVRELREFF